MKINKYEKYGTTMFKNVIKCISVISHEKKKRLKNYLNTNSYIYIEIYSI